MNHRWRILLILVVTLMIVGGWVQWHRHGGDRSETTSRSGERAIVIHCGSSMRPVAEQLAEAFREKHDVAVRFNFGGSAELLSAIELAREGDLYICHDPYAERLAEKGLLARAAAVGHLEPLIVVPKGNPRGIAAVADLARPGLRVGLPDPRYSTAGELVRNALTERGLTESVDRNVQLQTRGHNDLALALTAGQLDVAVAWNFIAGYYREQLDTVPLDIAFPETRVTVCRLTYANDIEAAEWFMQFAESSAGRQMFLDMGYRRTPPLPTTRGGE